MTMISLMSMLLLAAGQDAPGDQAPPQDVEDIPLTVTRDWPGLQPFDEEVIAHMRARDIPGGALAVSKDGRLLLARGYGRADREAGERVAPDSLFRIASLSKPITAVAVMRLLEEHEDTLALDTPVLDVLQYEPHLAPGAQADPRLRGVTIRHLLQHNGGWDRGVSFDPMFRPVTIAGELGVEQPARPEAVIRYMLGLPLDHDPGTTYAYSNFGYCVLGRLIEKASGMSYGEYVQARILAPLSITRMRLARTLPEHRAPGEVRYTDHRQGDNVFTPQEDDKVPLCYGGTHIEAMDAHGGWIASAVDLVRFACAFDDPENCPILKPESIETMFARPAPPNGYEPDGTPKAAYYALGWLVRPKGDGRANHWHGGRMAGTSSLLVTLHDGFNWAIVFNRGHDPSRLSYGAIDPALHRAAGRVEAWPEYDLFESGQF